MLQGRAARIATAVTAVSAVLFFTGALAKFGQNDFMYATAPAFWGTHTLYRDLTFVQAPGSIFIYGALYRLVDPADFYFALRVFSLSVLLLASLVTYRTARVLAGRVPALLAPLFLYTSPFVDSVAVDAGAASLALLFLAAALAVYFERPIGGRSAAVIGLSIGLAASMKLNFALYAIPFGLFIALRPGPRRAALLCYVAGGLAGSAPVWYYLLSDFAHFWFFNIRFHGLMNLHRMAVGHDPGTLILVGAVFFLLYASPVIYLGIKAAGRAGSPEERRRLLDLSALLATSLAAAFAPAYYAPQYLAAPVFLLALALALAARILTRRVDRPGRKAFRVAILVASFWVLAFWAQIFPYSLKVLAWDGASPLQMRKMRDRIDGVADAYLKDTSCAMTAISLSPVPLLGTAFELPSVNASGPFLPIVSDQIARHAPEFARYGLTADTLARLRPTAFLVGYYQSVPAERLLVEHARANDFVTFDVGALAGPAKDKRSLDMRLLVRRTCLQAPAS